MRTKSLSRKLLATVLSVYFLLTFAVTCFQVFGEYITSKSHIIGELVTLQKTFSGSLTRAIWELNTQQAITIAEGLLAIPMIEGIVVRDDNQDTISMLGRVPSIAEKYRNQLISEGVPLDDSRTGLFGYSFPLIFEFSGRATHVGDVTLISSREVVINRILISIYFLVGNALIKTAFLIFLLLHSFRKHLTDPLNELTQQIEDLEIDDLAGVRLDIHSAEDNELNVMESAFNRLITKVQEYKQELEKAKHDLQLSNDKLDKHNLTLEQEVARKTSILSHAMIDLQQQKHQLEQQQKELTVEISKRRQKENELTHKRQELEKMVDELNQAQDRLVQNEKFAAIGGLVAGLTHEVNTPIGIGVTAITFLAERLESLEEAFDSKTLSQKSLENFISEMKQGSSLLMSNLQRASELTASFKQITVDQASEAIRLINLKTYLNEIIKSLYPKLKKHNHIIEINCPEDIELKIPAGAISQIFTNLILNSVIHGFEQKAKGLMKIDVEDQGEMLKITYSDNGKGMGGRQLEQIFDPFFTTKRDQGGSGLGTHIVYNLVRQTLDGTIEAHSVIGKGLSYLIFFPKQNSFAQPSHQFVPDI
ncbi:MAG: signal transduction histidine kinase [Alteromonadaceae bacterium]|jgi:signal transduction histidine kinase